MTREDQLNRSRMSKESLIVPPSGPTCQALKLKGDGHRKMIRNYSGYVGRSVVPLNLPLNQVQSRSASNIAGKLLKNKTQLTLKESQKHKSMTLSLKISPLASKKESYPNTAEKTDEAS